MERTSSLFGMAVLLVKVTCMPTLYALFSLSSSETVIQPGTAVWIVAVLCCYFGLRLLLRKERSLRTVILFCVVWFLLQAVLVFIFYEHLTTVLRVAIAVGMWVYSYLECYTAAVQEVSVEKVMSSFDTGMILLVVLLFLGKISQVSMVIFLPLATAEAVALCALIQRRAADRSEKRSSAAQGSLMITGTVLAFAAVACAVVFLASGQIKRILDMIWKGLLTAAQWVADILNAAIMFLLSLLPDPELGELEYDQQQVLDMLEEMEKAEVVDPTMLLYVFLGLIALLFVGVIVYQFVCGGKRISIGRTGGEKGIRRSRLGLGRLFRAFFQRLRERLTYQINCITKRNTAPGLFAYLERQGTMRRKGRKRGESCREFLVRTSANYPGAETDVLRLADALDTYYFGGGETLSHREVIAMRRRIKACGKS